MDHFNLFKIYWFYSLVYEDEFLPTKERPSENKCDRLKGEKFYNRNLRLSFEVFRVEGPIWLMLKQRQANQTWQTIHHHHAWLQSIRIHFKMTGMRVHACNSGAEKAETGGSLGLTGQAAWTNQWAPGSFLESCLRSAHSLKSQPNNALW